MKIGFKSEHAYPTPVALTLCGLATNPLAGGHSCAVHAIGSDGRVGPEVQREGVSNNSHSVLADPTNRFVYVPCIAQQGEVVCPARRCRRAAAAPRPAEEEGALDKPPARILTTTVRCWLIPGHREHHPWLPLRRRHALAVGESIINVWYSSERAQ